MSDFILLIGGIVVGILATAPIAYQLGRLMARRQMVDERRGDFRLVKAVHRSKSNVYRFPAGGEF